MGTFRPSPKSRQDAPCLLAPAPLASYKGAGVCIRREATSGRFAGLRVVRVSGQVRVYYNRPQVQREAPLMDLDTEARLWLDADLSRLGEHEPYDFQGLDPNTLGQPIRVTADGQILIGQE